MAVSDKIMFEIYRDPDPAGRYRVVYFSELDEHNKHAEINRAMAGEHFYDGFLLEYRKQDGKQKLIEILRRLNSGESLTPEDVDRQLRELEAVA